MPSADVFKDKFRAIDGSKTVVGLLNSLRTEGKSNNWSEQALELMNFLVEDGMLQPSA